MLKRRPASPGLKFINAAGDSTSLNIVADCVNRALAHSNSPSTFSTRRVNRSQSALVLYLAHHLGKGVANAPQLRANQFRALILGWEIEQLSEHMKVELACGDVLLGISDFNTEVLRRHFPQTPAMTVPICPPLPSALKPDRHRWGLDDDAFTFLSVFDPVSGFDRKNPLDVYESFVRAFPDRLDVRLIFKVHGKPQPRVTGGSGEGSRSRDFLDLCARDSRVRIIDEFLTYSDVLQLIASCDAYVSLARAEGLGLPVLEAMAVGVPTVCTDYSGHQAFAGSDSNLLVPYDLVPIPDDASEHYHPDKYRERPQWAQPHVEVAAAHFRSLADNPDLCREIAAAGQRAATEYQRSCATAPWVEKLLDLLSSSEVARQHPLRARAFEYLMETDVKEWQAHARDVRRARRQLVVRTALGRAKRRVTGDRS